MIARTRFLAAVTAAAALTIACGAPAPPAEVPHGYVEGAEEAAEAQSRLVVADAADGRVRVLDLTTEEVVDTGTVPGAGDVHGDGRFGYVVGADGTVQVVDSGAWMVDHGDHVHYYRAAIRPVGPVTGTPPISVFSDAAVTAVSHDDGTVTLLDRMRLDAGEVVEIARVPRGGVAVPFEEHVLASTGSGAVEVWDRAGQRVGTVEGTCPELEGAAVTRRGVILGCADGALLVDREGERFVGVAIPYPRAVPDAERAREFRHRPGSAVLAARAGDTGAWVLDASRRSWTFVATVPAEAVTVVGEALPLLVLGRDGALRAYDTASGRQDAETPLLSDPTGATIEVDPNRAYVNDPASGAIHEIDHGDSLRVARTFDVGGRASHITETGR